MKNLTLTTITLVLLASCSKDESIEIIDEIPKGVTELSITEILNVHSEYATIVTSGESDVEILQLEVFYDSESITSSSNRIIVDTDSLNNRVVLSTLLPETTYNVQVSVKTDDSTYFSQVESFSMPSVDESVDLNVFNSGFNTLIPCFTVNEVGYGFQIIRIGDSNGNIDVSLNLISHNPKSDQSETFKVEFRPNTDLLDAIDNSDHVIVLVEGGKPYFIVPSKGQIFSMDLATLFVDPYMDLNFQHGAYISGSLDEYNGNQFLTVLEGSSLDDRSLNIYEIDFDAKSMNLQTSIEANFKTGLSLTVVIENTFFALVDGTISDAQAEIYTYDFNNDQFQFAGTDLVIPDHYLFGHKLKQEGSDLYLITRTVNSNNQSVMRYNISNSSLESVKDLAQNHVIYSYLIGSNLYLYVPGGSSRRHFTFDISNL